ncbi:MAG: hypothetical protein ACI30W_01340, partial [Muribaculaceae bacterium]
MTYHPPITTYTADEERDIATICTAAERMMETRYFCGYSTVSPTIEPYEQSDDYVSIGTVRRLYPYGYNWLYDHGIATRVIDGTVCYSLAAIAYEHERYRGMVAWSK